MGNLPRVLQKLCKHGNATAIVIPRFVLFEIGWVCGQAVMVEVLDDQSVRIRLPQQQDFAPLAAPRILGGAPVLVKP